MVTSAFGTWLSMTRRELHLQSLSVEYETRKDVAMIRSTFAVWHRMAIIQGVQQKIIAIQEQKLLKTTWDQWQLTRSVSLFRALYDNSGFKGGRTMSVSPFPNGVQNHAHYGHGENG